MIKKCLLFTQVAGGGRITDNESQNLDLGIEQLVPVNALGKKYLISKSKSKIDSDNHRVGILITAVEVRDYSSYTFNGSSYSLSNGSVQYHRIANFDNSGTGHEWRTL